MKWNALIAVFMLSLTASAQAKPASKGTHLPLGKTPAEPPMAPRAAPNDRVLADATAATSAGPTALLAWETQRSASMAGGSSPATAIGLACGAVTWKQNTKIATCAADLTSWCGCYTPNPKDKTQQAGIRDILAIVRSPPTRAAYFLHHRNDLLDPFNQFVAAQGPASAATADTNLKDKKVRDEAKANYEKVLSTLSTGFFNSDAGGAAATETATGSLPGLDLNALLQNALAGLALALQQRAEQEAMAYFIEQLRQQLCSSDEIKPWVPNTCRVLGDADTSAAPSSLFTLLKSAITEDLRSAPATLVSAVVAKSDSKITKEILAPPLETFVGTLAHNGDPLRAADQLASDLGDAIDADALAASPKYTPADRLPFRAIQCTAGGAPALVRVEQELSSAAQGKAALSPGDRDQALALLVLDRTECDFLERTQGTQPFDGDATYFDRLATDMLILSPGIDSFGNAAADINAAIAAGRALQSQIASPPDPAKTQAAVDAAKAQAVAAAAATVATELARAFDATGLTLKTLARLAKKKDAQISGAPTGTGHEVVAVLAEARLRLNDAADALRAFSALASLDFPALWREVAKHLSIVECEKNTFCLKAPKAVVQVGGLLVSVAQAKTPDDVSKAILAAAEPADSWKAQYDTSIGSTVSLGGLVGFGLTGKAKTTLIPNYNNDFFHRPIVAAAGVEWTLSHSNLWSTGLFFQLLDLGGYLQTNGNTVRPLQSLSPGLWLRLGILKTPFVLAVGAAYDIDDGTAPQAHASARGGALIAVDTRLWTLSRSPSSPGAYTGLWPDPSTRISLSVASLGAVNLATFGNQGPRLFDRPVSATLGLDWAFGHEGFGLYAQALDFVGYGYPTAPQWNPVFRGLSPGAWFRWRARTTPLFIAAGVVSDLANDGGSARGGVLIGMALDWAVLVRQDTTEESAQKAIRRAGAAQ